MKKRCIEENCDDRARYGTGGVGQYCKLHKLEGLRNVNVKYCQYEHDVCDVQASFGYLEEDGGDGRVLYCVTHKKKGMENVVTARCIFKRCRSFARFGFEGGHFKEYCLKHKLLGMENLQHKRCEYRRCRTKPTFGFHEIGIVRFCDRHKQFGMERVVPHYFKSQHSVSEDDQPLPNRSPLSNVDIFHPKVYPSRKSKTAALASLAQCVELDSNDNNSENISEIETDDEPEIEGIEEFKILQGELILK